MGNSCSNNVLATPSTKQERSRRFDLCDATEDNHDHCVVTTGMESPTLYSNEEMEGKKIRICTDPDCEAIYQIVETPTGETLTFNGSDATMSSALSDEDVTSELPTIPENKALPRNC